MSDELPITTTKVTDKSIELRHAVPDDLEALTSIYNHYVRHSIATFDTTPFNPDARRTWLSHFAVGSPHQLWVAVRQGAILGYASSSQYRQKAAYDTSVETTIYLHPDHLGAGIGHHLYAHLFARLSLYGLHRAYAAIAQPNPASVALHESFDFKRVGTFSEAGQKFGGYHNVDWYEKSLGPSVNQATTP